MTPLFCKDLERRKQKELFSINMLLAERNLDTPLGLPSEEQSEAELSKNQFRILSAPNTKGYYKPMCNLLIEVK